MRDFQQRPIKVSLPGAAIPRPLAPRAAAWLERRLNRQDIRSLVLLTLAMYVLVLAISFFTQSAGRTVFGPQLGADFGAFYAAGRIYREAGPSQIYDRALHRRIYRELYPTAPAGEELPYVNAPFFALPLPLLARLPYRAAWLCWIGLSVGLFLFGFDRLWRVLDRMPAEDKPLAALLAATFMPFMVECLSGGQTSAFGFAALALAISLDRRGLQALSGMAVSLCLYKPTLLALLLPMLLLTRRFRALAGAAAGAALLALVSLLLVGVDGCRSYLRMLLFFADNSTSAATGLKSWKYIDINSFSRLLFPELPGLRWGLVAVVLAIMLPLLARLWWRAASRPESQSLVWASAITWTLVLNLYLGIYDATLAALAALLVCDLWRRDAPPFSPPRRLLLLALYLVPWITQPLAKLTGVQTLTLTLALFGAWQLVMLRQREIARPRRGGIDFSHG